MKKFLLSLAALALVACNATPTKAAEPYTLDTCVVMDSKLGSMGDPITLVYHGRELKFCCQPCVDAFFEDPDHYLAQLDEEVAKSKD